jgi:hypothetical protein
MISYKERNYIKEALAQISSGEKFVRVDKTLAWVPSDITEDKVQAFISAVEQTYVAEQAEFEFDSSKFEVSFVKENKRVSVKPGLYGKTNVLLGEQVYKSFTEVRQAKVFAVQLEYASKNAKKPDFNKSMVESLKKI